MKPVNKISAEDLKKLAAMSDADIERKLKNVISSTNGNALKSLLSNIDVASIKKQIQGKSPENFSKLIDTLGNLDDSLIEKIKNQLK